MSAWEMKLITAEAQSAVLFVGGSDDPDQLRIFEWLRTTAAIYHVFIKRFMRTDDPADPNRWVDLLDRLEREEVRHFRATRPARFGPTFVPTSGPPQCVSERDGVSPSNREVRELLIPVIDALLDPGTLPPGFQLVLREIDRFLATRDQETVSLAAHATSAEMKDARRLLNGRSVVMMGGTAGPTPRQCLRSHSA